MSTEPASCGIRVVQRHHVKRRAWRAIGRRLGYAAPNAIISINRDTDRPGAVLLHLNSGGNAIAVSTALRDAGYQVQDGPPHPSRYGVQLLVLPATQVANQ